MRPRINVLTLAVKDLDKAHAFYRDGLGLPSKGILGEEFKGNDNEPSGRVAFFQLRGGLIFALYERADLAKDAHIREDAPSSTEFSIGYAVKAKEEVDVLLARAQEAGGTVTAPAHDRPWGIYSGYFKDIDGHLWEVLWNPGLEVLD